MKKTIKFGPIKTMVDVYHQNELMYADCGSEGSTDPDCDCDMVDGGQLTASYVIGKGKRRTGHRIILAGPTILQLKVWN